MLLFPMLDLGLLHLDGLWWPWAVERPTGGPRQACCRQRRSSEKTELWKKPSPEGREKVVSRERRLRRSCQDHSAREHGARLVLDRVRFLAATLAMQGAASAQVGAAEICSPVSMDRKVCLEDVSMCDWTEQPGCVCEEATSRSDRTDPGRPASFGCPCHSSSDDHHQKL